MDINLRKSGHCNNKCSSSVPLTYRYLKPQFLRTLNESALSLYEFKLSVAEEIDLLLSKPLTNNHSDFLRIVESVTPQGLLQRPK